MGTRNPITIHPACPGQHTWTSYHEGDPEHGAPCDCGRRFWGQPEVPRWLIRDGRSGLWWRPGGYGYTSDLLQAGIFTEAKARSHEGPAYADRQDKAVHLSEVVDTARQSETLPALLALLEGR